MSEVFFCVDPGEREVAAALKSRLERAGFEVAVDDSGQQSVAAKWEGGLSSAAILLFLSPQSLPPRPGRADWGALLDHMASGATPPVASLLVQDCQFPRLLERKNFFRWQGEEIESLRALERWVLRLEPTREESFVPARLPWFEGREREIETLWETLVDSAGAVAVVNPDPGSGKNDSRARIRTARRQAFPANHMDSRRRPFLRLNRGGSGRASRRRLPR